jgi:hypothetical protein
MALILCQALLSACHIRGYRNFSLHSQKGRWAAQPLHSFLSLSRPVPSPLTLCTTTQAIEIWKKNTMLKFRVANNIPLGIKKILVFFLIVVDSCHTFCMVSASVSALLSSCKVSRWTCMDISWIKWHSKPLDHIRNQRYQVGHLLT